MGTHILGSTANGNPVQFWFFSDANVSVKGNETLTAPEELYIDTIHVFGATKNGASAPAMAGIYNPATGALLAFTPNFTLGTAIQYYTASFAAGSFYHVTAGGTFKLGLSENGKGLQTWGRGDGGTWDYRLVWPLPNPFGGTNQTGLGNWPAYVTYFPKATITGYKSGGIATTHSNPTATLEIDGKSFTAGVTGIDFNGVAADLGTLTVTSDTALTITVPIGATTGPVHVATNAGTATGATLTVSGGRVEQGGALKSTTAIRVRQAGALKQVIRIRSFDGALLKDVH